MLWKEIQAQYPDKWAILDNREMSGADIVSADLIGICSDEDVALKKAESMKNGHAYWFVRTTTTPFPSYIHANNVNVGVKQQ